MHCLTTLRITLNLFDLSVLVCREAMTLCFTEALRQGFTLYVRPHLDDGTANGAWRNGLLLQPAVKYNGYRYG